VRAHLFSRRASISLSIWLAISFCAAADSLRVGNPAKVPLQFSITQDVGSGNEVFVAGAHPDLSSGGIQPWGDKLHWSTGNVWSGSIAIEAGAQVTYTYYRHPISTGGFCSGNSTAISQPETSPFRVRPDIHTPASSFATSRPGVRVAFSFATLPRMAPGRK
jgi:hypothetical protein